MGQGLLYVVQPGGGVGGGGGGYEKGTPFVYILFTNGTPFTRLSQSRSLLISGFSSWP